ncbi:MAG TPA: phosphoribosylglycinamide synthetase C domain-containing protein, partial [Chitinophagaceae bacterium]|nr:phosphoribosylglycinamide synthetase C domain-containing protein [Chitinophagaceae bacterium]
LVGLCVAATNQELDQVILRVDERAAATVMAVSFGYPLAYEKGHEITGLNKKFGKNTLVFQAGTRSEKGKVVTSGGRVLCVTAYGKNIPDAVEHSLHALDKIHFEGIYYRTDIGFEFKN